MPNTLLLVDDEVAILRALKRVLDSSSYQILTASSGEEALNLLKNNEIQVIISDQRMPYMTGSELLSQVKNSYPDTIRIILSGYADFDAVSEAINKGAIYKFLNKPWDNEKLRQIVHESFKLHDLQVRNKQAGQALERSLEGVIITDKNHIVQQTNTTVLNLLGYEEKESIKQVPKVLSLDLEQPIFKEIQKIIGQKGIWSGEVLILRKNEETFPAYLSVSSVKDVNNNDINYIYSILDISNQKAEEEKLLYGDQLTSLPNRFFFFDHLLTELSSLQKSQRQAALLIIKIDRFSNLNDAWGRDVGDHILQEMAKRLKELIPNEKDLSRLGSDEFAVFFHDVTPQPSFDNFIQSLIQTLKEPFLVKGDKLYITTSIGVSVYPQHASTYDQLIKRAHLALLEAKEKGGDNYILYDPKMVTGLAHPLILENDLHKAIEKQEFLLYFQPLFTIDKKEVVGLEALLRWQHPKYGLLNPQQFIELAEKSGLITPIGTWVLQTACQQLKECENLCYKGIYVAVNVSPRQFNDPQIFETIRESIFSSQISPQNLILEITESLLMQDTESSVNTLKSLKDIGLQIALDDFGTGYSSLNYLNRFPINILKIDKSFVDVLPVSKNDEAIVRAIITIGKKLGLKIVAEGVETQEQLNLLKKLKCDLIQGYLFSSPLSTTELHTFLKNHFIESKSTPLH
jgi:diguanylate cyclase (GGDEF)-like protein/PAS domain S-box-containing protein